MIDLHLNSIEYFALSAKTHKVLQNGVAQRTNSSESYNTVHSFGCMCKIFHIITQF